MKKIIIILIFFLSCTYDFNNETELDKFISENVFELMPVIHMNFLTSCYYPVQKICLSIEALKKQTFTTTQKQQLCNQMDTVLAQGGESGEQKDLYCGQITSKIYSQGCSINFSFDSIAKIYSLYFYSDSTPQKTLQQYCEGIRSTIANQYNLEPEMFYIYYF
ncbi:MAG: hypothetical protein KatS3mg129_2485 [Leptospiraceae bacterium]|nr:MAG: hypothetical protein KatS3mg129_2485 [Leptospiraceae bacterium]